VNSLTARRVGLRGGIREDLPPSDEKQERAPPGAGNCFTNSVWIRKRRRKLMGAMNLVLDEVQSKFGISEQQPDRCFPGYSLSLINRMAA